MPFILSIESTSPICSVALSSNSNVLAIRETSENNHSTILTQFVIDVLKEAGLKPEDLDAVAVSKGPGSYTGLRIGVSAAKGLCYSIDIPLISVDTLYALANIARPKYPDCMLCPMIDARRMEVYTAVYDSNMNEIEHVEAKIIDSESFKDILFDNKVIFLGSGTSKCKDILISENAVFNLDFQVSARNLVTIAEQKFEKSIFEDIAYFEPFYLKEFIPKKPVVKALRK